MKQPASFWSAIPLFLCLELFLQGCSSSSTPPPAPPSPPAGGISNTPINFTSGNGHLVISMPPDFVVETVPVPITGTVKAFDTAGNPIASTDQVTYTFSSPNDAFATICPAAVGCPAVAPTGCPFGLGTAQAFAYCGSTLPTYSIVFKTVQNRGRTDTLQLSAVDNTTTSIVFPTVSAAIRIWFHYGNFGVQGLSYYKTGAGGPGTSCNGYFGSSIQFCSLPLGACVSPTFPLVDFEDGSKSHVDFMVPVYDINASSRTAYWNSATQSGLGNWGAISDAVETPLGLSGTSVDVYWSFH